MFTAAVAVKRMTSEQEQLFSRIAIVFRTISRFFSDKAKIARRKRHRTGEIKICSEIEL